MAAQPMLLLTPTWPRRDGFGSERRAFQWLATLAAQGPVHLVRISELADAPPASLLQSGLAASAAGFVCQRQERWWRGLPLNLASLQRLRRTAPDWVRLAPAEKGALRAHIARVVSRPAQLYVFRLFLAEAALALPPELLAACTVDLDDWESRTRASIARRCLAHGFLRLAARNAAAARQYRRLERIHLPGYDRIVVAAAEDAAALARQGLRAAIAAEPNRLAEAPRPAPTPRQGGDFRILFVGRLDYPPNSDAALFIADALAPRLRRRGTGFRLVLAGSNPPAWLAQRLRAAGVEFHADVEGLASCYDAADAAIVPLFCGGGTKLKLLEAFHYRKPVMSSPHGIRGTMARDGAHCLVARSAEEFAAACDRLRASPELAARLAAAGEELLNAHYRLAVPA